MAPLGTQPMHVVVLPCIFVSLRPSDGGSGTHVEGELRSGEEAVGSTMEVPSMKVKGVGKGIEAREWVGSSLLLFDFLLSPHSPASFGFLSCPVIIIVSNFIVQ